MATKAKTPSQGINEAVQEAAVTAIVLVVVVLIFIFQMDPNSFHFLKSLIKW